MSLLDLNPDELLSTTRAVRKRLDLTKPVPDDLIRECVALALQAPSASNQISMRFVVVRDRARIAAIARIRRYNASLRAERIFAMRKRSGIGSANLPASLVKRC